MIGIVQEDRERIEGVLYELSDETMKLFDNLKKLSEVKHVRIKVKVKLEDGNIEEAFTCLCPKKDGHFEPSKEYIDIIIEGAKINNLSPKYIDYLRSFINR